VNKRTFILTLTICIFTATISHARKTTERDLVKIAAGLNKNMNRTPDPSNGFRMDSVAGGPGLTFTSNFTATRHTATDFKGKDFHTWMKNTILGNLCTDQDLKKRLQDDVIFRYNYKGYDGSNIANIKIDRRDCNY
jgi:hypothetical protein